MSFIHRICVGLACLVAVPLAAQMTVRTKDGRVFTLPVAESEVASIEYSAQSGSQTAPTLNQAGSPWVVNAEGRIYAGDGRSWRELEGRAHDIGLGADGSAWVIGHDSVPGGYGIHRWTGSTWVKVEGGAVRISVDGRGTPWVVNHLGNIFRRSGSGWQQLPGLAKDIGVNAQGQAWVIGTDPEPGGFGIHRFNGTQWEKVPGGAVRLAVDPQGQPWVVNSEGRIFQRTGASWRELPGRARDIGVGSDGTVWVIGTGTVPGGHSIHRWNGSAWSQIEGGAEAIAVR